MLSRDDLEANVNEKNQNKNRARSPSSHLLIYTHARSPDPSPGSDRGSICRAGSSKSLDQRTDIRRVKPPKIAGAFFFLCGTLYRVIHERPLSLFSWMVPFDSSGPQRTQQRHQRTTRVQALRYGGCWLTERRWKSEARQKAEDLKQTRV